MKQKIVEPLEMSCPRCGATMMAAVWPYLKGTLERGEQLTWRRCAACQTLFSRLTELTMASQERA